MDQSTPSAPRPALAGWRCFHCGDEFTEDDIGRAAAEDHFGLTPEWNPLCLAERTMPHREALRELRALRVRVGHLEHDLAQRTEVMGYVRAREEVLCGSVSRLLGDPSIKRDHDVLTAVDHWKSRADVAEGMLQWINERAGEGCVTVGFEMDGGLHVTLDPMGSDQTAAREDNVQCGILQLRDQDNPPKHDAPVILRWLERALGAGGRLIVFRGGTPDVTSVRAEFWRGAVPVAAIGYGEHLSEAILDVSQKATVREFLK